MKKLLKKIMRYVMVSAVICLMAACANDAEKAGTGENGDVKNGGIAEGVNDAAAVGKAGTNGSESPDASENRTGGDPIPAPTSEPTSKPTAKPTATPVPTGLPDGREIVIRESRYYRNDVPLIDIRTNGNKGIFSRDVWNGAVIRVASYDEDANAYVVEETYACEYKGRGNSTWNYRKKPFNIKFEEKTGFLGMDKGKRFSFIANWLDRSGLRNYLSFTVAEMLTEANYKDGKVKKKNYLGEGWEWTPDCRFVEVQIDGNYAGLFLAAETVRIGNNRLELTEQNEEGTVSSENLGMLFEMSIDGYTWTTDEYLDRIVNSKGFIPYNVKHPDYYTELSGDDREWVREYINGIEDIVFAEPSADSWKKICEVLDVTSFADFWIVQAFAGNGELTHPKSVFMYKNNSDPDFTGDNADTNGGKLFAGPVWDFDWGTYVKNLAGDVYPTDTIYYGALFEYQEFADLVRERWEIIEDRLGDETLTDLYETYREIQLAMANDDKLFPYRNRDRVNYDMAMTLEKSVTSLQDYVRKRKEALAAQIDALCE